MPTTTSWSGRTSGREPADIRATDGEDALQTWRSRRSSRRCGCRRRPSSALRPRWCSMTLPSGRFGDAAQVVWLRARPRRSVRASALVPDDGTEATDAAWLARQAADREELYAAIADLVIDVDDLTPETVAAVGSSSGWRRVVERGCVHRSGVQGMTMSARARDGAPMVGRQAGARHGRRPGYRSRHLPGTAGCRLRCVRPLPETAAMAHGALESRSRPARPPLCPRVGRPDRGARLREPRGDGRGGLPGRPRRAHQQRRLPGRSPDLAEADDAFWARGASRSNLGSTRRVTRAALPHLIGAARTAVAPASSTSPRSPAAGAGMRVRSPTPRPRVPS